MIAILACSTYSVVLIFIILCLYLYDLNLVEWATAKVRYIDVFNFSNVEETVCSPTPYVIFSVLSLIFAIFVSTEIPERIVLLTMWITTILFLLKWFIRRGRWKVTKVFWRVLCVPFYKVHF